MKYGESAFDILYLLTAVIIGALILIKAKNRTERIMGAACLILGCGDAFHLVPRVLNYFADGDFTRGRNQMHMIDAIIDKATSPAILTSYASLMDSLSYCVMTDMPKDKISDLVKMQLSDNASWHITSQTVTGWFDTRYCYLGGMDLSVVMPDYDQLSAASEKIHAVERGEKLED